MKLPDYVPTVVVNLDRPRKMALTHRAFKRIEQALGHKIDDGSTPPRLWDLGTYVWGALVDEDREGLTAGDVEDMLCLGNQEEVNDAFNRLATLSGAKDDPEGKAEPQVMEVEIR